MTLSVRAVSRRVDASYAAADSFNFISSAFAEETGSQRDIRLNDVRIEDGTVRILYDNQGTERRVEHIDAALSLPHITDPLTAKGKVDWKGKPVNFDLTLTSPGELRNAKAAKLELALGTDAVDATFEGTVLSRPSFVLEGELGAKSHSIPVIARLDARSAGFGLGARRRRVAKPCAVEES